MRLSRFPCPSPLLHPKPWTIFPSTNVCPLEAHVGWQLRLTRVQLILRSTDRFPAAAQNPSSFQGPPSVDSSSISASYGRRSMAQSLRIQLPRRSHHSRLMRDWREKMAKTLDRTDCPTCLGGTSPDYALHPCPECWGSQTIPHVTSPTRSALVGLYRWLATRLPKLTARRPHG